MGFSMLLYALRSDDYNHILQVVLIGCVLLSCGTQQKQQYYQDQPPASVSAAQDLCTRAQSTSYTALCIHRRGDSRELSGVQGSRFKQLASLVVARTTPPEELDAMHQLFESLDVDSSGTISYEKLHKGLAEKCHVRSQLPVWSSAGFAESIGMPLK